MSRLNLCTNPSFENNTTSWNVYATFATVARSTAHARDGAASMLATFSAGTDGRIQTYTPFAATAGTHYTLSLYVYVPSGQPGVKLNFRTSFASSSTHDQWERLTVSNVAAGSVENLVIQAGSTVGGTFYVDDVLIEAAPVALSYFDGSYPGGSWTGTAGNSTSTLVTTPSVTVTNDPTNVPPRNILFVSDSTGTSITITRTDPDGTQRPVRTAEAGPLIGGTWSGYDYESPFDPTGSKTLTYTAQANDGSSPFTATVPALNIKQSWLIHPGIPDLSQPITITDADPGETFDSGATAHNVLGRSTPIIVTDGVRRSPQSSITLATMDTATRTAMQALLADTSPLLLQAVVLGASAQALFPSLTLFPDENLYPGGVSDSFSTYDWVAIDQVTRDRAGGILADQFRRWTLPYQVVDRPAGGVAAQRTWADLIAGSTTWQDVLSKYATWNGALTGSAGS